MPFVFLILGCFLLGGAGAWLVSKAGPGWGLIDAPTERSSHTHPTPKGGGVGILLAFGAAGLFLGVSPFFLLPAFLLALTSLAGDRLPLSPRLRLLVQFLAAGVVVGHGAAGGLFPGWLGVAAALIYVVGTANFYNFMDGINGIAGLTGVIAFSLLANHGYSGGKDVGLTTLCAGLAAACLGFLPFNCPRAKVFMGDVGSILLGFVYAAVVVTFAGSLGEGLVLMSYLFPFYADELLTMVERLVDRQSLFRPHRRHLYQVLVNEGGLPHWQVAAGYGFVQVVVGVLVPSLVGPPVGLVLFLFFVLFALGNYRIKQRLAA